MSVFVGVRLPELLAARIDEEAAKHSASRSGEIIAALSRAFLAPTERETTSKARQVASTVLNVTTAAQLPPQHNYERPKHAENCHCYACKPPAS